VAVGAGPTASELLALQSRERSLHIQQQHRRRPFEISGIPEFCASELSSSFSAMDLLRDMPPLGEEFWIFAHRLLSLP